MFLQIFLFITQFPIVFVIIKMRIEMEQQHMSTQPATVAVPESAIFVFILH